MNICVVLLFELGGLYVLSRTRNISYVFGPAGYQEMLEDTPIGARFTFVPLFTLLARHTAHEAESEQNEHRG